MPTNTNKFMKRIFVIDWWLLPAFALTVYSGFELHIAGHFSSHEVWHNWAVFHIITSLSFIIAGILHIKTHWGWYKSLISKGLGKKSPVTAWLSLIYTATVLTGIALLSIEGGNSGIGLWHYRIGILLTTIAAVHIIKRMAVIRKSIGK